MKITFPRVIGFALMALGLALMAGGLSYYWLASDVYRSTARISIQKELTDVGTSSSMASGHRDPFWIQNQFEKVRAKATLYSVITNLDLQTKWAGAGKPEIRLEEAHDLLRTRLEVRQSRHTPEIIEISVWSEEPDEAAQIANEIARVYLDQRLATKRTIRIVGIQTLEKQLAEIEQQVLDSAALVARLGSGLNTTISEIPLADVPPEIETQHRAYFDARRNLETEERIRAALNFRIEQERKSLEPDILAPGHSPVEIIDLAEPALRPMTSRPLMAGGLFALGLLLLGAALPLIRPSEPKTLLEISQPEKAV
jgi:capsular polysaccharide biosynthesis protein